MALIKNKSVMKDPWKHVSDGEELPVEKSIIISLNRWQNEHETLSKRNAPLGIRLGSNQPPSEIRADLSKFDVIALDFPAFTDGRAYSYARLIRERYGFSGEIRAVGNVLRDQLDLMQRCGFDAFEVANEKTAKKWLDAIDEIEMVYQPTGDGIETIMSQRLPGSARR
jgi:uncharacterized protein (DUF934 family)